MCSHEQEEHEVCVGMAESVILLQNGGFRRDMSHIYSTVHTTGDVCGYGTRCALTTECILFIENVFYTSYRMCYTTMEEHEQEAHGAHPPHELSEAYICTYVLCVCVCVCVCVCEKKVSHRVCTPAYTRHIQN